MTPIAQTSARASTSMRRRDLLGRHVVRRADEHALLLRAQRSHRLVEARAEVEHLGDDPVALAREKDVRGLEVAMHDVLLVRSGDRVGDGDHDLERLGGGEATVARAEVLLEILPGEQLLDDERRSVVVTRDVEHVDDVRVADGSRGARLAEEAHHVVFVARVLLVQELDGDLATERNVLSLDTPRPCRRCRGSLRAGTFHRGNRPFARLLLPPRGLPLR